MMKIKTFPFTSKTYLKNTNNVYIKISNYSEIRLR